MHILGEVDFGLARANQRASLARQLVPVGPLFAVTSSGSEASWVYRPRLYITSWPLNASGNLVGALTGHLPVRFADGATPEHHGSVPLVPTLMLGGARPALAQLPSAAGGWSLHLPSRAPGTVVAKPPLCLAALPSSRGQGAELNPRAAARGSKSDPSPEPAILQEAYMRLHKSNQTKSLSTQDWEWLLGLPAAWTAALRRDHFLWLADVCPTHVGAAIFQSLPAALLIVPRPRAGGVGENLGPLRPVFERWSHLFAAPSHPLNRFNQHLRSVGKDPAHFAAPSYPEMHARGESAAAVGFQRGAVLS